MKVFHHNDIDGLSAAAVVARFTQNYNPDNYYMYDYSIPLPTEVVEEGETVYIVDLSFSINTVDKLKELIDEKHCDLIWCDHHTSTMEVLAQFPEYNSIKGLRSEKCSGAALTWMYFKNCEFEECPMFIKMISDFDCWKYEIEHTLHFKYALEAKDINPFSNIWNHLVRDQNTKGMPLLNEMIDKGIVIEKYMEQWFENYCTSYAYESEINGVKCLVCNIRANSLVFGDRIKDYPLVAIWVFDGEKYKYSIYSDKDNIDCSKIAENFGGGGHKGAAGFSTKQQILYKKENS
ncbi:MAG: hypothetical protein IKO36_06905 [Bacteroidaceae bacterium]|nr:hypothetical protein [Bacteroidaceae bacterium]